MSNEFNLERAKAWEGNRMMSKCLRCDSPVKARELCNRHYKSEKKNGGFVPIKTGRGKTISERLEMRSHRTRSGCIVWTGCADSDGYGSIKVNGKMQSTHRLAYESYIGEISGGLHVLHRCDNPPCINPAHLFLGTALDNASDRMEKGRHVAPRGEHNGNAKLKDRQVIAIRNETGNQKFAAEKYGVSQQTISRIKSGKRRPGAERIPRSSYQEVEVSDEN